MSPEGVYWLIEDMLRDAAEEEDYMVRRDQIDAIVITFQVAAYHVGSLYFVGPGADRRVTAYAEATGGANIKITEPWSEDPTVTTTRVVGWVTRP